MLKADFHTHSVASPDGGISAEDYRQLLDRGQLDYIAITDHNRIDFAQQMHQELGDKIIIGEEVMTSEGELIGLFLTKLVEPGQTARKTAEAIRDQGGIVYLPHPFETIRHGVQAETLDKMPKLIDVVEAHNGRAVLQNRSPQALTWATLHKKPTAASSDAHGAKGVGHTYTVVGQPLTKDTLQSLITQAELVHARPPLISLTYPKINRLKNKLRAR
jgi:predicted metal-dependent phosphoesterase TrpH